MRQVIQVKKGDQVLVEEDVKELMIGMLWDSYEELDEVHPEECEIVVVEKD